jgi:cell division protein FtsB
MRAMAKVDTAPFEEAERTSRVRFRGLEFFAGQIFTILASVVGVYLAGYVSFQRTLEYDRLTKAQQKSDLLTAAREELKQNVVRLQKFNERLPADVGTGVVNSEWPQLRLFVWQAAGRSSSAFDIPPQILIDMQAFYGDVELMLNDGEAHQNFRSLSQSNSYERNQFKQRLVTQLKLADTSIVPALNNEIGAAEQLTKKYSD